MLHKLQCATNSLPGCTRLVGRQNGNWDIFNFLFGASISVPLCYDVLNYVLLVQNLFGFPNFYFVVSNLMGHRQFLFRCVTRF